MLSTLGAHSFLIYVDNYLSSIISLVELDVKVLKCIDKYGMNEVPPLTCSYINVRYQRGTVLLNLSINRISLNLRTLLIYEPG